MSAKQLPPLKFQVILSRMLEAAITRPADLIDQLTPALQALVELLGIPALPSVEVSFDQLARHDQVMTLRVQGRRIRLAPELMEQVRAYITEAHPLGDYRNANYLEWTLNATPSEQIAFLSVSALEGIKQQIALCVDQSIIVEVYQICWQNDTAPPVDQAAFHHIVRDLLDLQIGLRNLPATCAALKSADADDLRETLIDALSAATLDLHMHSSTLREFSFATFDKASDHFPSMRDGLFLENGLLFPPFRLIEDDTLPEGFFALKVNDLMNVPQRGLLTDQILVNDTPQRLRLMDVPAQSMLNPATFHASAITRIDHKLMLEAGGLTTWDNAGFVILCLANWLRQSAKIFVTRQFVQRMIQQVEFAFPQLSRVVLDDLNLNVVTATLRQLAADDISIRNLAWIFELLVDLNDVDRATWITRVRAHLREQLTHQFSRGTNTVVVYLLEPALETRLSQRLDRADAATQEAEDEQLIEAIRHELSYLPATVQMPLVLTSAQPVRQNLQTLIRAEFPKLKVIDYGDLRPDVNVQPVARIQLEITH